MTMINEGFIVLGGIDMAKILLGMLHDGFPPYIPSQTSRRSLLSATIRSSATPSKDWIE